jgi:hypothetical protein
MGRDDFRGGVTRIDIRIPHLYSLVYVNDIRRRC